MSHWTLDSEQFAHLKWGSQTLVKQFENKQHSRERRYHGKEDGTAGTAQLLGSKRTSEGAWVSNYYSKNIMGT